MAFGDNACADTCYGDPLTQTHAVMQGIWAISTRFDSTSDTLLGRRQRSGSGHSPA